jgi:hypothetical protein
VSGWWIAARPCRGRQSLGVAQPRVEPVVERPDRLERCRDERADAVARQRSGRRVDGQQPLMTQVLGGLLRAATGAHVPEHLDLRRRELQLPAELADLAAERGDRAGREPSAIQRWLKNDTRNTAPPAWRTTSSARSPASRAPSGRGGGPARR